VKRRRIQISVGEAVFRGMNYVLVTLFVLTIVLPFVNVIALSFNNGLDAAKGGVYFWPRQFSLDNYKDVFQDPYFLSSYKITFLRVVIGTVLAVLLTGLAAYALKFPTLPGRRFWNFYILFTMLFSGGVVPYYMLLKGIKLTNTFWVFIVPWLYSAWNIILMRSFFQTIPTSLEESAQMDGANHLRTFFSIIMPLSKPIFSVIGLFVGVAHWNDWFTGAFYVSDKSLHPLQTVLRAMLMSAEAMRRQMVIIYTQQQGELLTVTTESLKMATIVVATVPIVCIYPFIQKYFVQGVMVGSIKE
jgi:putative aldouronate transport system permease protein